MGAGLFATIFGLHSGPEVLVTNRTNDKAIVLIDGETVGKSEKTNHLMWSEECTSWNFKCTETELEMFESVQRCQTCASQTIWCS